MSDRLTALAAAVAILGALVGERLGPSPGGWCLLMAAAMAAVAAVAGEVGPAVRAALALAALAACSAALLQRALDGLEGPLARLAVREPAVVARVHLVEEPRSRSRWSVRVLARVGASGIRGPANEAGAAAGGGAGSGPGAGSVVAVRAQGSAAERIRLLSAGESAVLRGRLRTRDAAEDRLKWRHAGAVLVADDLMAVAPPTSPAFRLANGLRRLVLSGTDWLPATPAALTTGLLVGDDRNLPLRVATDFRKAGLSHLLAVSGANVALVLALARPLLWRLGLAGRFAGGLAVVVLFAAMARFEPSVLRASAMAALGLLAGYLGRPASGRRLLALAVMGLVLADPFLVHSLGFRLSAAASAGILVLARPLAARIPGPAAVSAALSVTAAAQIAVAPVALPAFGTLPLVALPANLLAAPAAAALTLWGFGSGLAGGLASPLLPAAAAGLAVPSGILAGYLAAIADLGARWPVPVGPGPGVAIAAVSALELARRRAATARTGSAPRPPTRRRPTAPAPTARESEHRRR